MNTAVIKVELKPRRLPLAEAKRCCRFRGVGEAMQLGQAEGAIGVCDYGDPAPGSGWGGRLASASAE
jgi:hypothetical protein